MKRIILPITLLLVLFVLSCSEKTTQPFSKTVATPTFSLESGTYASQTQVTISCNTPEVTIRYTTDGTTPTNHSFEYTEPLVIDSSKLVKAMAFKKGWNQSATATAFYEVVNHGSIPSAQISRIIATPDTIYADNGVSFSSIKVTVKDIDGFSLPDISVSYIASMGNIMSSATTDEYGIASTTFKAELETGVATVWAVVRLYDPDHPNILVSADTAWVQVYINEAPPIVPAVHSLSFNNVNDINLNVLNTSNNDYAVLKVGLYDEFGSLFNTPQNVWFKIINTNPPLGANINNQSQADSVMVTSSNGYAQVNIFSGTVPGNVTVRVSCTSGGRYITANKTNIRINPGPAHNIVINAGGENSGVSLGSGLWSIVVCAQMQDIYGNPSVYGQSVWFSLPDNPYNCQIGTIAYIGNESASGDSVAGIAFTNLIYRGDFTFEGLAIRATTGGINGAEVFAETYIILPLNQPQLELEMIPGNIVYHGNNNTVPASATATVNASVFDVQGCPIHNARINLTSTNGVFEYIAGTNEDPLNHNMQDTPYLIVTDWYNPLAQGYTDVDDGQDGLAQGNIRFYAWEIPFADPMINSPALTVATITGRLSGIEIITSSTVSLIRYPT